MSKLNTCQAVLTIGIVWWVAGCAPQAQQFDTNGVAMSDANETLKACIHGIDARAEYVSLVPYTVTNNNPTIAQMTDERLPTRQEATLYGQRADEVIGDCVTPYRDAIARYRPWLVNPNAEYLDSVRATVVLTVERKITWAERLRRNQAAAATLRQEIASINQARNAEIAQDRNQRAQNAAASLSALAAFQNANRPYIPPATFVPAPVYRAPAYQAPQPIQIQPFSCTRLGAFVNCQ